MTQQCSNRFATEYQQILRQIDGVDPVRYAKTRNYADGAVTRLSPYISRGVISTRMILEKILRLGLAFDRIEKFVQELAWRDYWQQIWVAKGNAINRDLKQPQQDVAHQQIPRALVNAATSIHAIDEAIEELYQGGYIHNHMRMYVAAIACNIGKSHWRMPARWRYYHLLDGDWASNALSWPWVAGSNANKKYFANQDNLTKYVHCTQKNTSLDKTYAVLVDAQAPPVLVDSLQLSLPCDLPDNTTIELDPQLPTLIYNYYNLDPAWRQNEKANRILLLEPALFNAYPVAPKNIDFMLKLADNIPGLQLFCGEYEQLHRLTSPGAIIYKEHPLNRHYQGQQDPRDWMFQVQGYFPSFFAFWKRCKKELKAW